MEQKGEMEEVVGAEPRYCSAVLCDDGNTTSFEKPSNMSWCNCIYGLSTKCQISSVMVRKPNPNS